MDLEAEVSAPSGLGHSRYIATATTNKQTPWPLVRKRTIPTERPPLVGEI
jgi:hypothetical protein